MDKEDVVHIYNGMLLSHKKGNWVICSDVDGPTRVCHTEWSKPEREKQMLCIKVRMWNLKQWHWWACLLGRKRNADIENGHGDPTGEGEEGTEWESSADIYPLPRIRWTASGKLLYSTGSSALCSVTTPRGLRWGVEWEGSSRGRRYM